jgi:hypothetical protein
MIKNRDGIAFLSTLTSKVLYLLCIWLAISYWALFTFVVNASYVTRGSFLLSMLHEDRRNEIISENKKYRSVWVWYDSKSTYLYQMCTSLKLANKGNVRFYLIVYFDKPFVWQIGFHNNKTGNKTISLVNCD